MNIRINRIISQIPSCVVLCKITHEPTKTSLQKKDGVVQLIGFGTFTVKSRAARKGRKGEKP
ncbi:MAG: HU family DNA-binding protein [Candidatus Anammoxibacter sp.]